MTNARPRRFKILYLILLILIAISVVPLWIYGGKMMSINKDRLELQENVMQVVLSQSVAQEVSLYIGSVTQQLKDLFEPVVELAIQTPPAKYETDTKLRLSLEDFLRDRPNVLYATVLNFEAKGVQAGAYNAASDAFLRRALEAAFTAARQEEEFRSNPIPIYRNGVNEPVMVIAHPINSKGRFMGMVGAVITLEPVVQRLKNVQQLGLEAYIVDNTGRLVASNNPDRNISGMDMVNDPIVQKFLTWRGQAQATETSPFDMVQNGQTVAMLGTYSSIQSMGWGVIVQRKLSDAYYVVDQMRIETIRWGLVMIILSLVVGAFAAKTITRPIDLLTRTARQIAQREFTRRADIRSRTEIGELAETFNQMADDIQGYIGDLQRASEENRALFIDSIEMIAAAVDAKDPYTKGHSRRVSQYSVLLAKEMGLDEDEVDKVRISATLHDVGKIGIEDRVLKKPGVLTNEEFEIMKRHTVMGYEIVRQVKQLGEMLPGIRWHHESLNGKGYPDGIKGDEIPLMVRIISVADTFDAITTDRPYQAGSEFPKALEVLRKHAGSKYDPIVVDALHSSYAKGDLAKHETRRSALISVPQTASTTAVRS
jgi:HD-GYP domain-containing protein (c-di-GMP phosphodiesterase class II)